MSNTYSQIYFHIIFSVKNRKDLIQEEWEVNLYKYISSVIQSKGHKPIIVNGYKDHVHIFFSGSSHLVISDLVRDIKRSSSRFINNELNTKEHFQWQSGYGIFSYSKSDMPKVINYIKNQKKHHEGISFEDEYLTFLNKFDVEYDNRYVFG